MQGDKRTTVVQLVGKLSDGGAETLIKDYALLLDKEKFNVKIIVIRSDDKPAVARILRDKKIEMIPIYPHYTVLTGIFHRLFGREYIPHRLAQILKRERADVLHVHLANLHYVAAISDKIKGMRICYTCHNLPELFFSGKREPEFRAAQKLIQNNNLQLIALHEDMRRELNEMFGVDNTVVIRNAVDFSRFTEISESKEAIRDRLNIPREAFVLGHVGRFEDVKNHKLLIEIFRELCRKRENSYLLMVGDGSLRTDVEAQLHQYGLDGRYQILSHRSDVPQLMKAMDVFVLPSKFEGLPVVLVEAQAISLRCVISDKVSQEAILTDFVVPVGLKESPEKWCDVILDESIRGQAHGTLKDYDMNSEIKRLEKLYVGELHG